jgi:hypothetical protein
MLIALGHHRIQFAHSVPRCLPGRHDRVERGDNRAKLLIHVVRRSMLIFGLGLTTLFGTLAGQLLQAKRSMEEKAAWMFLAGNCLLFAGLMLSNGLRPVRTVSPDAGDRQGIGCFAAHPDLRQRLRAACLTDQRVASVCDRERSVLLYHCPRDVLKAARKLCSARPRSSDSVNPNSRAAISYSPFIVVWNIAGSSVFRMSGTPAS